MTPTLFFCDASVPPLQYRQWIQSLETGGNVEIADWGAISPPPSLDGKRFVERWVGWSNAQPSLNIVAHGWGAYVALWLARQVSSPHLSFFLVAPQLSCGTQRLGWLMRVPGLNLSLIRMGLVERQSEYLRHLGYPAQLPVPWIQQWCRDTSDPRVWLRAWQWRSFGAQNPLNQSEGGGLFSGSPAWIVRGDQDRVSSPEVEAKALQDMFPAALVKTVSRSGHALPWTHLAELETWRRECQGK